MMGLFSFTSGLWCCGDGMFCGPAPPGWPTATPPPPPTPTATPAAPRTWVLLPGCCDFFADWDGTPDHHDGGAGSHAVDIDINGAYCDANHNCTPNCGGICPDVFYYDRSGSVSPPSFIQFDHSCASGIGGGQHVEANLLSLNPPGQEVGLLKYLHLENAINSGTVVHDGMRVGTVNPMAGWDCWTGPHLHQRITAEGSATLRHLTPPDGFNCVSNGAASSAVPCYSLSW